MRVVIDTNVFVSSFFGGHPRTVIDLWKSNKITLCLTGMILDEYYDVLRRMGLANQELDEIFSLFKKNFNCIFTLKTPTIAISEDLDDNKFVEAAVACNARFIISGDNHLLKIKKYSDIEIIKPAVFLTRHPLASF